MALFKFWKTKQKEKKEPQYKEFLDKNFSMCCQDLWEGYSMEEIKNKHPFYGQAFENFLLVNNFTCDEVLAIYQYSIGSNMMLGLARNTVTKEDIKENILDELSNRVKKETPDHLQVDLLNQARSFVEGLDTSKKYIELKPIVDNFLEQSGIRSMCVHTAVMDLVRLKNTEKAIQELNASLSKHQLKENTILYRGVSSSYLQGVKNMEDLVGQVIANTSATSTTYDRNAGFIGSKHVDLVFEICATSETKGINIEQLSGYDNEKEVLLASNNLEVVDVRKEMVTNHDNTQVEKWFVSCNVAPLDLEKATIVDNKKAKKEREKEIETKIEKE